MHDEFTEIGLKLEKFHKQSIFRLVCPNKFSAKKWQSSESLSNTTRKHKYASFANPLKLLIVETIA